LVRHHAISITHTYHPIPILNHTIPVPSPHGPRRISQVRRREISYERKEQENQARLG
jgi:hypothetical protein